MTDRTEKKRKIMRTLPVWIIAVLALVYLNSYKETKEQSVILLVMTGAALLVTLLFAFLKRPDPENKTYVLRQAAAFLAAPAVMAAAVEVLNGNLIWQLPVPIDILLNYLVYLAVFVLFYGLCGSAEYGGKAAVALLLVFGVANMFLKDYKGSPLLPMDLGSIRTAANVAAVFTFQINCRIVTALALSCAAWYMLGRRKMLKKHRLRQRIERAAGLALIAGVCLVFYGTDTFSDNFMKPDFFNQTRGYETHGAFAEFMLNTKYLFMNEPNGYSSGKVAELLEDAERSRTSVYESAMMRQNDPVTAGTAPAKKPNIIVIMNESYSDLSVIGDFGTNIPYMPYVNSLIGQENVIEGNVYVSTIGTGTSNTEFEFLTGNTMAFLPGGSNAYQLYVNHEQPGLVTTLKDQSYTADAVHPYYRSSWNRTAVYDYMHFDRFLSIEDMHDYVKVRRFVSDEWDFDEIERMYREKGDDPMFIFNITMQNHSSYEIKYDNFPEKVWLTDMEGSYPETDQYLALIKKTDESFRDLIEYFSEQEEPTIILMFGDHQPFIEDGFYEEVMGMKLNDLPDEIQQKRYITRFILWANYDIPEGYIDEISVNYLSPLLMECTGLQMTPYQKWLADLYEEVPVITAMGCRDSSGSFFQADEKNSHEEAISAYRNIAYNNLFDAKNRIEEFFRVGK
ncbi:MAG: LTA synthase family protein [Solobacterium sp.]|nr:LTA synthase family protein [Solobacterium sp.]